MTVAARPTGMAFEAAAEAMDVVVSCANPPLSPAAETGPTSGGAWAPLPPRQREARRRRARGLSVEMVEMVGMADR